MGQRFKSAAWAIFSKLKLTLPFCQKRNVCRTYACKMFFFHQLALLATAPTTSDYLTLAWQEAAREIEGIPYLPQLR